MRANVKRGFNRLFVVLTGVWVIYCLLVYPMQQRESTDAVYRNELQRCYEDKLGKGPEFKDCLQYAEIKSGVNGWSLRAFYARESWFLVLVVVMVPLVVYGLCRGLAAVSGWVWRGFSLLLVALSLSSCGSDILPDNAPKLIDADGSPYVACEGLVWVSTQEGGIGGASYSVRFTEKGGTARDLRGIKKLDISDPPKGFDPCKSQDVKTAEKGTPDCRNGYVLYSDVKSYALLHDEPVSDVGSRVQEHGCKIVDTLPQQ